MQNTKVVSVPLPLANHFKLSTDQRPKTDEERREMSLIPYANIRSLVCAQMDTQSVVALPTTEVEYIALTEVVKEGLWLKGILQDFGVRQESISVKCDSNNVICLAKHQVFHERNMLTKPLPVSKFCYCFDLLSVISC
ncbi:hypothetical protein AAHA92_14283 [Salvia divinorum]|uniref:Uncharacterized protein n=1 Tax=Salvia divinorum TaxID=28513 RepID=A0ABD1HB15_SALDI